MDASDERAVGSCKSDLECSLNGVCTAGTCVCVKPWGGASCGVLQYATTPRSGHSIFDQNFTHNTWNGPIVGPVDGKYHAFIPLYGNFTGIKSLFRVMYIMHGLSDAIAGPYSWFKEPTLPGGINPAFLTYTNSTTKKPTYSLWDGDIRIADSPAMHNFTSLGRHQGGCGGNPAPARAKNGTFYCVSQHTRELVSATKLGEWSYVSDINLTLSNGSTVSYASAFANVEDPFLWIDLRGNFHILNHRFVQSETTHCHSSTISAHVFSPDGQHWHALEPAVQPYGHTVQYDDGSNFSFTTLERPNAHFDERGVMTHINFAADLTTPDAGCNDNVEAGHTGKARSCAECKFYRHCGTTVVALDVE